MGERIAGEQVRPSVIIEDPLRAPKIPPKYTFLGGLRVGRVACNQPDY